MDKLFTTLKRRRNTWLWIAGGILVIALIAVVVIGPGVGSLVGTAGGGSLLITPANPAIQVGQAVTFKVDMGGSGDSALCRWESSDTRVIRVVGQSSRDSISIEGRQPGQTTLTVSCGGATGSTVVTIGGQSMPVTPANPSVAVGQQAQVKIDLGSAGNPATCRWTSENMNIANVNRQEPGNVALIEGKQVGTVKISVACGLQVGSAGVTVILP